MHCVWIYKVAQKKFLSATVTMKLQDEAGVAVIKIIGVSIGVEYGHTQDLNAMLDLKKGIDNLLRRIYIRVGRPG